ncbi:AT-rich interactive domain-containing protein 2 [Senna tora]|uniref:AT-rich interactive domain-containing protein 2 n=1 Tax=Senna tora TaxID=362788 RepID=A0A834TVJ9_9FABA|nr:AT-rich interactive domain-containing protein 2 [Senna tora]
MHLSYTWKEDCSQVGATQRLTNSASFALSICAQKSVPLYSFHLDGSGMGSIERRKGRLATFLIHFSIADNGSRLRFRDLTSSLVTSESIVGRTSSTPLINFKSSSPWIMWSSSHIVEAKTSRFKPNSFATEPHNPSFDTKLYPPFSFTKRNRLYKSSDWPSPSTTGRRQPLPWYAPTDSRQSTEDPSVKVDHRAMSFDFLLRCSSAYGPMVKIKEIYLIPERGGSSAARIGKMEVGAQEYQYCTLMSRRWTESEVDARHAMKMEMHRD